MTYTIANTLKPEQVSALPAYITGTMPDGMMNGLVAQSSAPEDVKAVATQAIANLTQPGVVGHSLAIAEPAGGSVSDITVKSDSPTQIDPAQSTFDKVQTGGVNYWVNLAAIISPGSTVTLDYDVTTAPGSADLTFDQTPAAGDNAQVTYEDSTQ